MSKELLDKFGIETEITPENIEEVYSQIESKVKDKLINDGAFLSSITEEKIPTEILNKKVNEGKLAETFRQIKEIDREFGLTAEEKSAFGEDEKKDATKYLKKAKSLATAKLQGDTKALQELQQSNANLQQMIEAKDSEFEKLRDSLETKYNSQLNEMTKERLIRSMNQKLQESVIGDVDAMFDIPYAKINQKYDLVVEDGKILVYQKGTKLRVPNPSKTGVFMDILELLPEEYKALKVWKENKAVDPVNIEITAKSPLDKVLAQKRAEALAKKQSLGV